jgi:hypothetical protein
LGERVEPQDVESREKLGITDNLRYKVVYPNSAVNSIAPESG